MSDKPYDPDTRCELCHGKAAPLFSFGWIDSKGEWRDQAKTCGRCAQAQAVRQQRSVEFEQFRERMSRFGTRPIISLSTGA